MAVRGNSAHTRIRLGRCFGPRSDCASRKLVKATGSKSRVGTTAAITRSPTSGSGAAYTDTWAKPSYRIRMRSMGAEPMFSPSTRNHPELRPAKYTNPSASR